MTAAFKEAGLLTEQHEGWLPDPDGPTFVIPGAQHHDTREASRAYAQEHRPGNPVDIIWGKIYDPTNKQIVDRVGPGDWQDQKWTEVGTVIYNPNAQGPGLPMMEIKDSI